VSDIPGDARQLADAISDACGKAGERSTHRRFRLPGARCISCSLMPTRF
jgi:hypothetical protein